MLKLFENRTAFDVANIVAGLALVLSPWVLGFSGEASAAWNAWLVGAVVALIAGIAVIAFREYEEWANLALGLWAIAAPWILKFSDLGAATIAHLVIGALVAALAAASLWFTTNKPFSHA